MMSAKTVVSETPACPTPVTGASAITTGVPGETPTDFQNLLAGAVAPMEPSLGDSLATQPLTQLLLLKNPRQQQQPAAGTITPAAAPPPAEVCPVDMLKILDAAATLLPEAGIEGKGEVEVELPEDLPDGEDLTASEAEAISEWLEQMVPASVFAPQAGSKPAADVLQGQGGSGDVKGRQTMPTSLQRQALVPEQLMPVDDVTPGTVAATAPGVKPDLAAAQNPVTAFAAVMAVKGESTEKDKPSADGWMSALGDLAAKRGHDAAPAMGPRLSTPVHDARWADALGHRLVMMARDGESTASLKLVPVDLGPLDIQITVRDGEASVHFSAAHQETRNVLEASLPRLRELLGAQGLQLANASVSQQSGGQNRPEKSSGPAAVGAVVEDGEVAGSRAVSTSLLDIYA